MISKSNEEIAITVKGVFKSFKLPHEQHSGIKQLLVNKLNGRRGFEIQEVLNDISLEIKKGEFFGIVGRNGSGKSTLLKLLAGIYIPNKGLIKINGSLTPFIELGVGFNPELTGRENVYMNGALLGFSRKEVTMIYDDIVDFAEIEKFMDQKLKNYSSGMQVRLAFSIAIRAESDILLFDEVLAVGDAAFQQKCYATFEDLKEAGKTIVLVTHDMSAVQRFCARAIMIEDGLITLEGNPSEVADRYLEQNFDKKKTSKNSSDKEESVNYIVSHVSLSLDNKAIKSFSLSDEITVRFMVESDDEMTPFHIGFQIFTTEGTYVFGTNSMNSKVAPLVGKVSEVEIVMNQSLLPGTYHITLAVMNAKATQVLRYIPKIVTFNIKQETKVQGITMIDSKWVVKEHSGVSQKGSKI